MASISGAIAPFHSRGKGEDEEEEEERERGKNPQSHLYPSLENGGGGKRKEWVEMVGG